MKISVVMPVYNGEKYLREAIKSVLAQTHTDFEFIIINDGSTDSTPTILAHYADHRIRIIDQANAGISKALNNGINIAKGEYIARFDADDISHPKRLEQQFSFLESNVDVVLVGSNATVISAKGEYLYSSKLPLEIDNPAILYKNVPLFHSSVMFRKSAFKKAGGYREDIIQHFEDKLLWAKMLEIGKLANLEQSLIKYRLTPQSISNKNAKLYKLQAKISNACLRGEQVDDKIYKHFLQLTQLPPVTKEFLYYYRVSKIFLTQQNDKTMAMKYLRQALAISPLNPKAIKLLCYSFFCSNKHTNNQNIQ